MERGAQPTRRPSTEMNRFAGASHYEAWLGCVLNTKAIPRRPIRRRGMGLVYWRKGWPEFRR